MQADSISAVLGCLDKKQHILVSTKGGKKYETTAEMINLHHDKCYLDMAIIANDLSQRNINDRDRRNYKNVLFIDFTDVESILAYTESLNI